MDAQDGLAALVLFYVRDGLAGLWDVLREYHNARRECRRQAQSF